jgi:hypothetical protein
MKKKDALLQQISELILENEKTTPEGWSRIVVMAEFGPGMSAISGYVFDQDGTASTALPRKPDPQDAIEALRTEMTEPGKEPWVACLIQLDAKDEDVELNAEFEYDDVNRWHITAGNREEILAKLRPSTKKPKKKR